MKKLTLTILLLALLLTACAGTATPTPAAEPVAAAESSSGSVTAEGKLLPAPAVELGFAQGGVVAEVLAQPGDKVAAGEVLARLVGIKTVQAELAAAQAQYDQTYSAALSEDKSNRTQDWYKTQPGEFSLPLWYYDQQEQIGAAQDTADEAREALTRAQEKLASRVQTTGAEFIRVETELAKAQAAYRVAKNLNDRLSKGKDIDELTRRQVYLLQRDEYLKSKGLDARWVTTVNKINKDLRDEAQKFFDDAKENLKDAQEDYDDELTSDGAKDILKARAQVSIAQERYHTALDYVRVLQTGSEAQTVAAAATALDKAEAAMELYELRTPFGGTLLSLDLSAGETAVPGRAVAFLADTATWTVETKDLAELDIARVALGQGVTVKLDALPGEEFSGKVTAIDPVGKEYLGDMTYKVTVTLDEADPRFLWNMTATVNIEAK
jgi:multidrug resistance efflux pump